MPNIKYLRVLYKELRDDFCSIRYLSDATFMSKNHIWNTLRLLKAMDIIEERFAENKKNMRVYRFKSDKYTDFEKFIENFTEKL